MATSQTTPGAGTETKTAPIIDKDLLSQIITEMEANNPYGLGKYTDEDASLLGLPSLGSLRLAHTLVKQWMGTPFIPRWIADAQNPAGTFVATVIRGQELGFKMMESLSVLYLSPDGRLGMYGTAMLALMRKAGISLTFTPLEDGFQLHGKRKDGDEYTSIFTHEDAVRAGLWDNKMQMHKRYPNWMAKWRTVSDMFRSLASDLTGGASAVYTKEELEDDMRAAANDRGAGDTSVFHEHAQKEEVNPFHVGTKRPATEPEAAFYVKTATVEKPAAAPAPAEKAPEPEIRPVPQEAPPAPREEPAPAPVAAASAATNVVQMPAPAAATPALVPPAAKKRTHQQRLAEITELIPGRSPAALEKKEFPEFMRGFLKMAKLPKNDPRYDDAISVLYWIAKHYRAQLIQDAHQVGLVAGEGWIRLAAWMEEHAWPEDCRGLARIVAFERYADSGGADLLEFLEDTVKIHELNVPDLRAFLQVLIKTRKAMLLREAAGTGSISELVLSWGLDLLKATDAEVEAKLEPSGATPAAAQPAPVAEPDEIDSIRSLFDDEEEPSAT